MKNRFYISILTFLFALNCFSVIAFCEDSENNCYWMNYGVAVLDGNNVTQGNEYLFVLSGSKGQVITKKCTLAENAYRICTDFSQDIKTAGSDFYTFGVYNEKNELIGTCEEFYFGDGGIGLGNDNTSTDGICGNEIVVKAVTNDLPYFWKYYVSNSEVFSVKSTSITDYYEGYEYENDDFNAGTDVYTQYVFTPLKKGTAEITFVYGTGEADSKSKVYKLIYNVDEELNITLAEKTEYEFVCGDVDNDGKLTAADSALILKKVINSAASFSAEIPEQNRLIIADADFNGVLTANDAAVVLNKSVN